MRRRDGWHDLIKQADREFLVAASAADLLDERLRADPVYLRPRNLGLPDAVRMRSGLEATYLIRLYAVFEAALREAWSSALGRSTGPPIRNLIDAIAGRRHSVPDDVRLAVHEVREYRNSLVHVGDVGPIDLSAARRRLSRFLSYLPKIGEAGFRMASSESPDAERSDADDLAFVYELKKPVGIRPVLYLLGGFALLGVAGVMFLIGLILPPERQAFVVFIGSTVVPTLGAVALFSAAFGLMRSPRRVTVGPAGLSVDGDGGSKSWRWDEVGWATVGTASVTPRRQLVVYDAAGKKLVTIGPEFEDFDGLAETVKAAIAKKGDGTADRLQGRKAKKSGAFLVLGGIAFLALAVANGINAQNEKIAAERLKRGGVEANATVVRRYLYNVTPRIEYLLATPEGRGVRRDAMMQQAAWDGLEGATTVAVRYVPDDPENNRLAAGEVENEFGPPETNLFLSVGVGIMATFFLAVGAMQWAGWDIDFDSKTGRISVKRFGTGR